MNECRYPEKFAGLKVEIEIIQSDFHALRYCIMLVVFIVCIEFLSHFLLFVVFLVTNDVSCTNALGFVAVPLVMKREYELVMGKRPIQFPLTPILVL